jgi:hypothetical protein
VYLDVGSISKTKAKLPSKRSFAGDGLKANLQLVES